ncbi:PWWP domain-containing protein 2A [Cephus cinctus]|uniref:PWWP domain-containing protein 2A n=1 Tax=Cephus cinctus TaxID=211228 RepID=A0AAJ7R8C7_CEPCN|nr:PWWP domain-containing protein 2A [Cephus cinctus]XP_024936188.1 PWWP domain-containing protein 2A [Cephus cinctus]XP_024936189.1 PWWP domain-containing protein 2A [Cephus cinctus]XP_024936190.1 PWWP domain-containing protein 2A [Cephus cinctus]
MADVETPSAPVLVRGEKILVTVDSALPDIIVVSFDHGTKSFQGALLDVTKRGLPCGVQPPEPVPDPDGDKLATIAARFSYFQEKRGPPIAAKIDLRRNINPPARYKNARPTVRLRPRQVLCSKCRSICNENSENVDVSRKRKHEAQAHPQPTRRSDRRCAQQQPQSQKNQRSLFSQSQSDNTSQQSAKIPLSPVADSSKMTPSLIPKLSRLQPNEISSAMQSVGKVKMASGVQSAYWTRSEEDSSRNAEEPMESRAEPTELDSNPSTAYCATPRRLSSSSVESAKVPDEDDKKTLAAADSTMRLRTGRIPRKKRSVGSMEDLWDESVFEDPTRTARTTPVIKISFGAQGEGTVLKIPSKLQNPYDQEGDTDTEDTQAEMETDPLELPKSLENDYEYQEDGENGQEQVDPQKQGVKDASAKAAKRALKKAKKEARRKMLGGVSPARSPCNGSPRYNPTFDPLSYHRRKHKVKHKKKHKEERKHKNQQQPQEPGEEATATDAPQQQQNWDVLPGGDSSYTAIKEQCLKQKLSISLKRLNTNAYARCDYPVSNASSGCKSPGASSDELSEQEPEVDAGETAPDFPPPAHPLVMRLAATPVAHCLTASGRRMDVGDVVWGKIHGFPWWPGKVLSITVSCKEDGSSSGPQAHVAWYGSSTSSLMSCDQLSPFLETFKTRYNKKKRGPYKEAIRQAQSEARSQITPSTTESVLNVCGSPREVNVLS